MDTVVKCDGVSVNYGQDEVIKGITFSLKKSDFVGFVGPNGAGKTTLVKALLRLIPISAGKIYLFGKEQSQFSDWYKIGYLPQKFSSVNILFPASVEEVVSLGLLSLKKNPKIITLKDRKKIEQTLLELGIINLKDRLFFQLSGGQGQRVMLARALVSEPEILIFDEPSAALDPDARKDFFTLVKKLNKEKKITVIIVTHDTGYIGAYANKLLYLDQKLIYFGSISDFCPSEKIGHYFEKSDQHVIWHQHQ